LGIRRMKLVVCAAVVAVSLAAVPAGGADDPTPLGSSAQGASSGALSPDALRGTLFTATQTTTIGAVRAYLIGTGVPQSLFATVYVESFGEPNRLVGRSEPKLVSHSGGQWVEFPLTLGTRVEQNRGYYLLIHSGATGNAVSIAFDEGGSNRAIFLPVGFGTVPDPLLDAAFGGSAAHSFRTYSMYGVVDTTFPQSTAAPAVSGPSSAGPGSHVLTASNGSWTSSTAVTFTHQWQQCFPNGVTNIPEDWCNDLAGKTGSTMSVTPQPLTTMYRVVVTAQNARGRVARGSQVFILNSPTTNVVRPAITGIASPGSTVTSSFGHWIGLGTHPATAPPLPRLRLKWQRCLGGTCTDIPGAAAISPFNNAGDTSAYAVTGADLGHTLRTVVVGDKDALGQETATAFSDPTAVVAAGGGGGGGGGGGPSVPDLAVSLSANRTTLAPNGEADVVATVVNRGGAGALGTHLVITLPAGLTLLGSPAFERGSGCTGTPRVDCFLDYVPNGETTRVRFSVRAAASGAQVISAAATADRDSNAADNAASLTLTVEAPAPPRVPAGSSGVARSGSAGPDSLTGTAFADVLRGLGGNDRLNGRGGADKLYGGRGNDTLTGGTGLDLLDAGPGNDRLLARDRGRDTIRCGSGRDSVLADRTDRVARDCESVKRG
jgi:hypothetical protein